MKQLRTATTALAGSLALGVAVLAGPAFADEGNGETAPCAKEQGQLDKAQAKLEELQAKLAEKKAAVKDADTKAEKAKAKRAKEQVAKAKKAQAQRVLHKQEKLDECLAEQAPSETPTS